MAPAGEVLPPHGSNALPAGSTDEAVVATHNGGCHLSGFRRGSPSFPPPCTSTPPADESVGLHSATYVAFEGHHRMYSPPDGSASPTVPGGSRRLSECPKNWLPPRHRAGGHQGNGRQRQAPRPILKFMDARSGSCAGCGTRFFARRRPPRRRIVSIVCCKQTLDSLACTGLRRLGTRARLEKK